jgi:hypothetical protein
MERTGGGETTGGGASPHGGWVDWVSAYRERLVGRDGSAVRVVVISMLALGIAAAGWWVIGRVGDARVPLFEGRKVTRESTGRILSALQAAQVSAVVDAGGQVMVPASRRVEALRAVSKAKLAPRGFEEIREEASRPGSWLEGTEEREERQRRQTEREVEALLEEMPGITTANVIITRVRSTERGGSVWRNRATVRLAPASADGLISEGTIESCRALVSRVVANSGLDDIAIFDDKGRAYVAPGHPEAVARVRREAREFELRRLLEGQLSWIGDVRVFVVLEADVKGVEDSIALNRPLTVGGAEGDVEESMGRARVVIQVPTIYYINTFRQFIRDRGPSWEELEPYVATAEARIKHIVRGTIGEGELGELVIERVDTLALSESAREGESGRGLFRVPGWFPAAVAWGSIGVVMVSVWVWSVARRPASGVAAEVRRANGPRPTSPAALARARQLIESDTATAASVLERWVSMGVGG